MVSIAQYNREQIYFFSLADISKAIFNYSRDFWIDAIKLAEQANPMRPTDISFDSPAVDCSISESYNRLAMFFLQTMDTGAEYKDIETQTLIFESVLRGIKYGSQNARYLFPKLLQLDQLYELPEMVEIFNAEVSAVFIAPWWPKIPF